MHAYMKRLAVSLAIVVAALGPPMMLAISVSAIAGYVRGELALALELLRISATLGVWWVCAIVAAVNIGSPAPAMQMLLSAGGSTAFCGVAAAASVFFAPDLVSAYATCLILSLPMLALAAMNLRLVKRRAALG